MKKLLISLIILVFLVALVIVLFNSESTIKKENGKLNVIATVYPIYDFAKEIVGDKANVSMLLAPGVELHDYEPTPRRYYKNW